MTLKKALETVVLSGSMMLGAAAWAADAGAAASTDKAGTTAAAGATAPAAISDAQIAAIVVTANQVDIDAGKLAQGKAKHKDVKAFAKQMVTDHSALNKSVTALAKKLKVKPEESDTSKALKTGGEQNLAALKELKGAELDKAYIDHEVEYHQQVLDAVDNTLIPNAQNTELKAALEKARPAFAAHLEHAKKTQTALASVAE